MTKRKTATVASEPDESEPHTSDNDNNSNNNDNNESSSELGEDETVDVDFEFFDPKGIDFHGIKSLLSQTLSTDAELVNLSLIADLIISQPAIGSCVKVNEGNTYCTSLYSSLLLL